MKGICRMKDCTGCGLCASLCPQQCIEMRSVDKLGHLYPHIDVSLCTDCGKCRKVCPSVGKVTLTSPVTAYAAWAKDTDDYKSSSSGAASSVMARQIIRKGGIVYGCALLPGVEVKHIRVDKEKDLRLLKGSKYVQSDIREVLSLIKNDVGSGSPVLFIGTPCQVAAVRKLFGTQPCNLFLADLVCHGVPSVNLLRRHIDRIIPFQTCHSITFREGNNFCLKLISGDDRATAYESYLDTERYKDFYINSFMDGYTYRESCYGCRYASPERVGDVTVGDFWGLGKSASADMIPDHPDGCSLVMPISAKGHRLVEEIKPEMNIFERPVSEAVEGNDQLRKPVRKGPRKILYRALAGHFDSRWPYYLSVADLRVRIKFKKKKRV